MEKLVRDAASQLTIQIKQRECAIERVDALIAALEANNDLPF